MNGSIQQLQLHWVAKLTCAGLAACIADAITFPLHQGPIAGQDVRIQAAITTGAMAVTMAQCTDVFKAHLQAHSGSWYIYIFITYEELKRLLHYMNSAGPSPSCLIVGQDKIHLSRYSVLVVLSAAIIL
ncbi:hypothetical protein HPB50_029280 [Hyalomma asiaticum]|nr:hypothetical protein HPB50_029280 [Hyalomma asiaticum]